MIGYFENCPSHGLFLEDFKKGEQEEINEETEICHQVWKKRHNRAADQSQGYKDNSGHVRALGRDNNRHEAAHSSQEGTVQGD